MSFEQEKLSVTKNARTLALCGDHSNYTFEQAGYNTAGRAFAYRCKLRNLV
jgi:hypothetical protein